MQTPVRFRNHKYRNTGSGTDNRDNCWEFKHSQNHLSDRGTQGKTDNV